MLSIQITKRSDGGGVLRCVRADGSVTWQKQTARHAAFFALHDLTHFAVETTLGYRQGFFGLRRAFKHASCEVEDDHADGKPVHSEWKGRFNGKDFEVTGDPAADMRAYTKVNDQTLNMTTKKGGKVVSQGKIVVAADGKSRVVTTSGVTAKGKKFTNTAVYDKE